MRDKLSKLGAVPHEVECPVVYLNGELEDIHCWLCRQHTEDRRKELAYWKEFNDDSPE